MLSSQDSLKAIGKGAGILLTGVLISKIFGYFYRMAIARYLGPAEYGMLSIGMAIIGITTILAIFGLPQGMLRFISYYVGKQDNRGIDRTISSSVKLTLLSSVLLMFVLIFSSGYIASHFFNNPGIASIIILLALSLPFAVLLLNMELAAQAFNAVKYIVYARNITETASKLLITFLLLSLGMGIIGAVMGYVLGICISAALLFYLLQKKVYPLTHALKAKIAGLRPLLMFSLPLWLSDFVLASMLWVDTLFIGYFHASKLAGIYNAATPTAQIIHIIPLALYTLFYPVICRLYAQGSSITDVYKSVTKWIFFITLPMLIVMTLYSSRILSLLFGAQYAEGYIAMGVVTAAYFIYSIAITSNSVLAMLKKTKLIFINKLSAFCVYLGLNLLLIPRYGIVGAALSFAATAVVENLLVESEAYYFTRINPFKLNYLNALVASLIAGFAAYRLNIFFGASGAYILLFMAGFFVLYIALVLLLPGSIEEGDKEIIGSVLKRLKLRRARKAESR